MPIIRHNNSKSPVEEYWDQRVLGITSGIDDLGGIQWELLGTLTLGWVIVYLIIWKGLHASGKIIWFTALFPYFVMTILLFRSVTLEGASIGLIRYITPDWEKLYSTETWIDSATQVSLEKEKLCLDSTFCKFQFSDIFCLFYWNWSFASLGILQQIPPQLCQVSFLKNVT